MYEVSLYCDNRECILFQEVCWTITGFLLNELVQVQDSLGEEDAHYCPTCKSLLEVGEPQEMRIIPRD